MEKVGTTEIYEEDQEWEVEKILKEKIKRRKNPKTGRMEYIKEYLIKWIGYDDPSWEPEQNLDNCKELLSEFLIKKIKKCSKSLIKAKTPIKINPKKKIKNLTDYKTPRKLNLSFNQIIDETSTGSNSFTNNSYFLNRKRNSNRNRNNKNNNKNENKKYSDITVVEENDEVQNMQNMHYDIEIIDDYKGEEKSVDNISNIKENTNILLSNSSKESKNTAQFNLKQNCCQENKENKCVVEKENRENNINVINIEESNNDIGKYSQTIYIDYDDDEEYKNDNEMKNQVNTNLSKNDKKEMIINYNDEDYKEVKDFHEFEKTEKNLNNSNGKEFLNNYLEKKKYIDKFRNYDDIEEENIKVIGIYGIKVLENYGKGFILNVKCKKNNKIYYDEINSHSGKIPQEYIIKYYERLISQSFEKGEYFQELCFD